MESGRVALAGLLGRCPAMESLKRDIVRFGPSGLRVHVFGETGTGKEMVAKALHEASPRARRPLVPVNVAGFSDDLFVAELFGHARGAFTGAVAAREGYVAEAEGGTLFIDEVGDMSPLAQDAHARGQAVHDDGQSGTVRLAGGEKAQHGRNPGARIP